MTTHDEPVLVTTAPVSPGEERRARERRYLITMGVRVVAFVVAIVLGTAGGWLRVVGIIAIVLALVLPWVAVVLANAGPKRTSGRAGPSLYDGRPPPAIGQRDDR